MAIVKAPNRSSARLNMRAYQSIQGFSLIELMVGLSIMSMALASMSALGAGWVNESRVTDARSQIRLAYNKARAFSLQNSNASTTTSAWLCSALGVVYVYKATAANPSGPSACGDSGFAWKADLAGGSLTKIEVAAASNSTAFSCMGLNNRGLPVSSSLGLGTCTTSQTVYVKKGSVNEATTLN